MIEPHDLLYHLGLEHARHRWKAKVLLLDHHCLVIYLLMHITKCLISSFCNITKPLPTLICINAAIETLKFQRTTSASAEMTFPSVVRDLLILAPSFNRVPLAPVESARSLPARSTKLILLTCNKSNYVTAVQISRTPYRSQTMNL